MSTSEFLTPAQAAAIEPTVHPNTVLNWMQVGCRGVFLKFEMRGDRYLTTEAWLREFQEARKARATGRTPAARQTGISERKALRAMGV